MDIDSHFNKKKKLGWLNYTLVGGQVFLFLHLKRNSVLNLTIYNSSS
mgnify:CR=1 FL=1